MSVTGHQIPSPSSLVTPYPPHPLSGPGLGEQVQLQPPYRDWHIGAPTEPLRDAHNHNSGQAPSPLFSCCSQSTYLAVMKWETSCLIWEFWHWSAPWEGLTTQSDHPEIHQARAEHFEPAPIWTYNQGRPSAVGLSHCTAGQVPKEEPFCLTAPVVSVFNRSLGVMAGK